MNNGSRANFRWPRFSFAYVTVVVLASAVPTFATDSDAIESPPGASVDLSPERIQELMNVIYSGNGNEIATDEAEQFVATLRRKYPFLSIRKRLPQFISESQRPDIHLNDAAKKDLNDYESTHWGYTRTHGDDVRPRSLKALHEEQVSEFIARDGNGRMRTPPPGAVHLALALDDPIPFDQASLLTTAERAGSTLEILESIPRINEILIDEEEGEYDYHKAPEAYARWATKHNPLMLPNRRFLEYVHQDSHDQFLTEESRGYVRSLDEVSGFHPHHLSRRPRIEPWDYRDMIGFRRSLGEDVSSVDDETDPRRQPPKNAVWLLTELELVSLLMNPLPVVYQSRYLPRMDQLSQQETRRLDPFETQALQKLHDGEPIVIEARTNEIRMLGAIRAANSCLSCHDLRHAELLGAFTYTITRRIPINIDQKEGR